LNLEDFLRLVTRSEERMTRVAVAFAVACLMSGCIAVPVPTTQTDYRCTYVGGGYFSCHPWHTPWLPH